MKRIFILSALLALCFGAFAQKTIKCITVWQLDGSVDTFKLTDVKKLQIVDDDSSVYPPDTVSEYVDLGLPSGTLWATRNVGANFPSDNGDYFAWGETEPQADSSSYSFETYKWGEIHKSGSITYERYTKYVTKPTQIYEGFYDNKTELDKEDDAAYVNWGEDWRMPTHEQINELVAECTWKLTRYANSEGIFVKGYLVSSKVNDASIFLPCAGAVSYGRPWGEGDFFYCWSMECGSDGIGGAYCLSNNEGGYIRYKGFTVRPVRASAKKD